METKFIALFKNVSYQARLVASGGKNLRAAGWRKVLEELNKARNITTIEQLQSKWRRLKSDWVDYYFLCNLSGFGDGLDDDKWKELDARPGKLKLSRFRFAPFVHFDDMSILIGDSANT